MKPLTEEDIYTREQLIRIEDIYDLDGTMSEGEYELIMEHNHRDKFILAEDVLSAVALFENKLKKELLQAKNQDIADAFGIAFLIFRECFQIQEKDKEAGE